jgi:predicted RNase H-like nuclease (RuvC/YqgF family)
MAIQIGSQEAALLIAAASAAAGAMTVWGRWSGRRAAEMERTRREAREEQEHADKIKRLEEWREYHEDETKPLIDRFHKYEALVQTTAATVDHLSQDVRQLTDSNQEMLRETRESNRLTRELLTRFMSGELAWRPGPSSEGRSS